MQRDRERERERVTFKEPTGGGHCSNSLKWGDFVGDFVGGFDTGGWPVTPMLHQKKHLPSLGSSFQKLRLPKTQWVTGYGSAQTARLRIPKVDSESCCDVPVMKGTHAPTGNLLHVGTHSTGIKPTTVMLNQRGSTLNWAKRPLPRARCQANWAPDQELLMLLQHALSRRTMDGPTAYR